MNILVYQNKNNMLYITYLLLFTSGEIFHVSHIIRKQFERNAILKVFSVFTSSVAVVK